VTYITKRKDEEAIVKATQWKVIEMNSHLEEFTTAVETMSISESISILDKLIEDAKIFLAKSGESLKLISKRLDDHKANVKIEDENLAALKRSLAHIETLKEQGKREFEERIKSRERFEAGERVFYETMAVLEKSGDSSNDQEATLTETMDFHEHEIKANFVDVSSTIDLAL
jgi:hypothetical protein